MRRMARNVVWIWWIGCTTLGLAVAAAQDLPEMRPAVLKFELNLAKLRESKVVQGMLEDAPAMQGPDGAVLRSASRISGMVNAPPDLASVVDLGQREPLPFDFVLRLEFQDAEGATQLLNQTKSEAEEVTEFGKTWFKPNDSAGAPANLRIHVVDEKTIEFGTIGFLARPADEVVSAVMAKAWTSLQEPTLRVVGDLTGAQGFMRGVLAMMKEQTPPEARAFLAPLDKIAQFQLTADGGEGDLLALQITGVDAAGAGDIHDGLEALLGLARMAGGGQVEQLKETTPALAQAAEDILGALNSTLEGTTVKLVIPRPTSLEAALEEAVKSARSGAEQSQTMNRLRQLALAAHNYHDSYSHLPFADQKGLSWRVAVLPYLEENARFEMFDQKSAWDSEKNKSAADEMPAIFGEGMGTTDIVYVVPPKEVESFRDVTDGLSNVIMFVQVPTAIAWSKPQDMTPEEVLELYKALPEDGGLLVAFYDGSVRRLAAGMELEQVERLLDPADGAPVHLDE